MMKKVVLLLSLASLAIGSLLASPAFAFSDGTVLQRGQIGFDFTAGYKGFTISGAGGSAKVDFYRFYPDIGFGYKSFLGPTEFRFGIGGSSYTFSNADVPADNYSKGGIIFALSSGNLIIKEKAFVPGINIEGILDVSVFNNESIFFYGLAVIVNKHLGSSWNIFAEPGLFMFHFGDTARFNARLGGGVSYHFSPQITAKAAIDYDIGEFSGLQFKFGLGYNLSPPEQVEEGEEPTGYYRSREEKTASSVDLSQHVFSVVPAAAIPGETLQLKIRVAKGTSVASASAELGPEKSVTLKKTAANLWTTTYQLPLNLPRGRYQAAFTFRTKAGKTFSKKVSFQVE